jgi:hypothetical protein
VEEAIYVGGSMTGIFFLQHLGLAVDTSLGVRDMGTFDIPLIDRTGQIRYCPTLLNSIEAVIVAFRNRVAFNAVRMLTSYWAC